MIPPFIISSATQRYTEAVLCLSEPLTNVCCRAAARGAGGGAP